MVNIEYLLGKIKEFHMNKEEQKAWKVAICYLSYVDRLFPGIKQSKFKNDPRFSLIFKVCWKLIHELDLKDTDFKFYIKANLAILKANNSEFAVSPNCLVGEQAWNRWLVWKKKFNETFKDKTLADLGVQIEFDKIKDELEQTKIFLEKKIKILTKQKLEESFKTLVRWTVLKLITPYFLANLDITKDQNVLDRSALSLGQYKNNAANELIKGWFNVN